MVRVQPVLRKHSSVAELASASLQSLPRTSDAMTPVLPAATPRQSFTGNQRLSPYKRAAAISIAQIMQQNSSLPLQPAEGNILVPTPRPRQLAPLSRHGSVAQGSAATTPLDSFDGRQQFPVRTAAAVTIAQILRHDSSSAAQLAVDTLSPAPLRPRQLPPLRSPRRSAEGQQAVLGSPGPHAEGQQLTLGSPRCSAELAEAASTAPSSRRSSLSSSARATKEDGSLQQQSSVPVSPSGSLSPGRHPPNR